MQKLFFLKKRNTGLDFSTVLPPFSLNHQRICKLLHTQTGNCHKSPEIAMFFKLQSSIKIFTQKNSNPKSINSLGTVRYDSYRIPTFPFFSPRSQGHFSVHIHLLYVISIRDLSFPSYRKPNHFPSTQEQMQFGYSKLIIPVNFLTSAAQGWLFLFHPKNIFA